MQQALINKIIPMSAVDGPGNRFVIFLQECNFNCLYCHNPETITVCQKCGKCTIICPTHAIRYQDGSIFFNKKECIDCGECISSCPIGSDPRATLMSTDHIIDQIKKVHHFISGVTVSGGECTIQIEFLNELGKKAKALGINFLIDTNGSINLEKHPQLIENSDGFLLDVKSTDNEEHVSLTGKENKQVLKNLHLLLEQKKLKEVRTVIVPELLNNKNTVATISKILSNTATPYKLIKYRTHGTRTIMHHYKEPTDYFMLELQQIATKNGCKNCIIC